MNSFNTWKYNALKKSDKSKKGSIDKQIKPLIDKINNINNYFTTSSCSGRITIRIRPDSNSKKDVEFLYESHKPAALSSLKKSFKNIPKQQLWFRFEPAILHVACKCLDDANMLLKKAIPLFKHSGIISTAKNKIIVEIRGSEFIDAPIASNGHLIIDEEYIILLIKEANNKLRINHNKIKLLKLALSR